MNANHPKQRRQILRQDFEVMIASAVAALPQRIRKEIKNVAFVLDDETEAGRLLGHYHGIPNPKRGGNYFWVLPDKITIFQKAIAAEAEATGEPIGKVTRRVVWHEIGHYFGYDEKGIRRLERQWEKTGRLG